MSEIGSRPYPEPWGEVQKLVAEPVWLGVDEVELQALAQTARAVADLERASGDEIHSHAGRLEDNHAGGGLDAGPEALRRDSLALHVHAERCEKTAAILDEAAREIRETKVELSVLGAYAQAEQESWDVLLKQTANSRWVQKLAAKSLAKAQAAAKARADKAEAFFAVKIREHDELHAEEITVGHVDLDEVQGASAPSARHAAVEAAQAPVIQAQPVETEEERQAAVAGDAFEHHENAWPQQDAHRQAHHEWPPDFGAAHDSSAATSAQSGSAVLDHDTEAGVTEAQSATDFAVPDDVTNVDLQESSDTATMGAAGSLTGQAMGLANAEEQYRSPNAHGYHGDDGFFGDRRADALPMDVESRLARLAFWLKEQEDLFASQGLAVGGVPRYALAAHIDDQLQEHVYLYTNIGPGIVAKPVPLGVWPAWDLVVDPQNRDRAVLVRMLGHADPVHAAREHYLWLRDNWTAQGARYHLAGIATTHTPEEPETLRRLVQPLNDHISDADAPFLVEARGPLVEPEGGSMHPLQHVAPGLYVELAKVLATPWAGEARLQALGWVASIIEGSMAEDRAPFADIVAAIRERPPITPEMFNAVWADGAQVHTQTTVNLAHAMDKPLAQRGQSDFFGYLLYHRALVGLVALNHWRLSTARPDCAFVTDIAYLAAKANQEDPAFAAHITTLLPDTERSWWRKDQSS
ncbi:hypothetical protein Srot_0905 [Segniliparus rotundus DSM 44985]|uniref:Uncharacterized protein n=1 Tax=Segniliparus rotundus (strain ATCC BAA-972 / CDC 1076 / CIP 108378 / DSM 44985 / JCM 13578) TaxID=640132 RepID=D6ZEA2_SEGRD|nr:hypothetical protein [Segniliparus rotundus]ADG97382.1 hypothetical protein Srot_0905 [Segniliparus rotundus DSM 44985]